MGCGASKPAALDKKPGADRNSERDDGRRSKVPTQPGSDWCPPALRDSASQIIQHSCLIRALAIRLWLPLRVPFIINFDEFCPSNYIAET